ncbi:hypothetical protein [Streptomyces sp. NBC_00996]|uniref:hypothetical protein n=1 Tax=Streptomyces sp. NBC_00996 TaxID=2903710 RepID=UPI00386F758C|nr:hypothetical protein OG390_49145 [Streptomyces sp. NBC_00996]
MARAPSRFTPSACRVLTAPRPVPPRARLDGHGHIPTWPGHRGAEYVADWPDLPDWQKETDADIFEAIEDALK